MKGEQMALFLEGLFGKLTQFFFRVGFDILMMEEIWGNFIQKSVKHVRRSLKHLQAPEL